MVVVQRLPPARFARITEDLFWNNILKAVRLGWLDVQFVNVTGPEPLPLDELRRQLKCEKLLLFGRGLVASLPTNLALYQPYQIQNGPLLLAAAETEMLIGDEARRRDLWKALRTMFEL